MQIDSKTKVAIVYDRVNKWGGAERVLLVLKEMFPKAVLFTSVYDSDKAPWAKKFIKVNTSFLQKFPLAKSRHQLFATLMPLSFETLDFSEFDLVISVTSEAAKGVITRPSTKHLCYMLTPTRYLWSHYNKYFENPILRLISKPSVGYLRYWDKIASQRPDKIIAISKEVKKRVKKYYKREAKVIFPPVEMPINFIERKKAKDYYLVVSRLERYKRVDLAVDVFNKLKKKLIIVGVGGEEMKLKLKAKKNIQFAGFVKDSRLFELYKNAKGLIMPQEEDFGIVSVEAQTLGCPVIAYAKGGSLDTLIDGVTGVLFKRQTVDSMVDAVKRFDRMSFSTKKLQENAKRFSISVFKKEFLKEIQNL